MSIIVNVKTENTTDVLDKLMKLFQDTNHEVNIFNTKDGVFLEVNCGTCAQLDTEDQQDLPQPQNIIPTDIPAEDTVDPQVAINAFNQITSNQALFVPAQNELIKTEPSDSMTLFNLDSNYKTEVFIRPDIECSFLICDTISGINTESGEFAVFSYNGCDFKYPCCKSQCSEYLCIYVTASLISSGETKQIKLTLHTPCDNMPYALGSVILGQDNPFLINKE